MIVYVEGDATKPQVSTGGHVIIAHIVNDANGWGAGFSGQLSAKWPKAETDYRRWIRTRRPRLGDHLCTDVPGGTIFHMLAQRGFGPSAVPRVQLDALDKCLNSLAWYAQGYGSTCSVHMPRIGCGLGGGKWEQVEPLTQLALRNIPVVKVYDLPKV